MTAGYSGTALAVDIKVCAINDLWSGLKLVVKKEHRFARR
jgi:hypothetical protein